MRIIGAMRTRDGAWRVEVVKKLSGPPWYRLVHGDNVVDYLTISSVQALLAEAGVDMAELQEIDPAA